ncbi:hypothetical protein AAFF_G00322590 [Aldrovandia affinis]|uniref:Uncharacterized protein n=1 Tax=Aldrovandia affinis TaxID=143900 RepID=A0AAD7WQH5_9TELE|nr:hypothetical protein AAFF_G00322590 [Aldrovandia affinis]
MEALFPITTPPTLSLSSPINALTAGLSLRISSQVRRVACLQIQRSDGTWLSVAMPHVKRERGCAGRVHHQRAHAGPRPLRLSLPSHAHGPPGTNVSEMSNERVTHISHGARRGRRAGRRTQPKLSPAGGRAGGRGRITSAQIQRGYCHYTGLS